jgi:hypothetical protein
MEGYVRESIPFIFDPVSAAYVFLSSCEKDADDTYVV